METTAMIVGYVALTALFLAFGGLGVSFVIDAFGRRRDRRDDLVRRLEMRELGQNLLTASWWFSENKAAMDAIVEVARPMLRGVDPSQAVDESREEWRKKHGVARKVVGGD